MGQQSQISLLTCRFSDPALEKAYQGYMLSRHALFDRFALAAGLVVYLSYAIMDHLVLERAELAIRLRIGGVIVCAIALGCIQLQRTAIRLDRLIPLMVVFLGTLLNAIIYFEPGIENNYFIGLIQIAVFISFMLRAGFVSSNLALLALLGGYVFAVADKGLIGTLQLTIQMYFLVMMFTSCSCGIYILERYRRTLFLNACIIDQQNERLAEMITDLEKTVSRKTALLKVFAHVMKTPVHQIVGFLQVIRGELGGDGSRPTQSESIRYAESAAADLRQSVEEMVDYHFVDNAIRTAERERVDMLETLEEYFHDGIDSGEVTLKGDRIFVDADQPLLLMAVKYLRAHFRRPGRSLESITIRQSRSGAVEIDFADRGPAISEEKFQAETCLLTAIENYLSGEGANPSMILRIVSRALEKDGCELAILPAGLSGLRVTLPIRVRAAA